MSHQNRSTEFNYETWNWNHTEFGKRTPLNISAAADLKVLVFFWVPKCPWKFYKKVNFILVHTYCLKYMKTSALNILQRSYYFVYFLMHLWQIQHLLTFDQHLLPSWCLKNNQMAFLVFQASYCQQLFTTVKINKCWPKINKYWICPECTTKD